MTSEQDAGGRVELPVAAEMLIPHRPPAQLIDVVEACRPGEVRASMTPTAPHLAVSDGYVLESALVECVAQTAAALAGTSPINAAGTPSDSPGFLCRVRRFRIACRPPAGQRLEITVREEQQLGAMRLVSGTITCENDVVAEGELSLYG